MVGPHAARADLPRVVVVTCHWGEAIDEETTATRLVAGALARRAEVSVVHLVAPPGEAGCSTDSVFTVHRVPLHGARPLRAGLLRAALGAQDGGRRLPVGAAALLDRYEGAAPGVSELVRSLAPDSVVLAGHRQPWDLAALAGPARPRVVALPFLDDLQRLASPGVRRLLEVADALGVAHPGEGRAVLAALGGRRAGAVVPLDIALSVNRSATAARLFGVRFFGRYVLLIRSFPPGGGRFARSVTHEVLRHVVRDVSVAEIDDSHWRISDDENTLELPVNATRVNLWRLMAHALYTIDLRPPGPVGREAIESMLLGTPVVAPEPSAAMEHVAAANGGLWYRDAGELFDASRALMDGALRRRLAVQAREYADAHHGRTDDFVERMAALVLAPSRAALPR